MTRLTRLFAILTLSLGFNSAAIAQDGGSEVIIMQSGADELLADIEYLVGLAKAPLNKQWDNLNGTIDFFLPGIDRTKTVRIDVLSDNNGKIRYRPHFPIKNIKDFEKLNLVPAGITVKRSGRGFYKLGAAFTGFMRYQNKYASIGELANDVPKNLADPTKAIAALVAKKYDLALQVKNDAKGQADRKKSIQELRKELLSAVKKQDEEADDQFSMRKMLLEHQLDELERFVVESEEIVLSWSTDVKEKQGRSEIKLSPLAGTTLEASVKQLGQSASLFANVPRSDDAIFNLRLNHPLDDLRKAHFTEFFEKLQPMIAKKIDEQKELSDGEKTASKKISEHVFDMLNAGTEAGLIDAFLQVTQDKDDHKGLLDAIKVVDSAPALEILKLLPESNKKNSVKMDVDKVGEIAIHEVVLASSPVLDLESILGKKEVTGHVAVSKDQVWFSAGEGSLEQLKAALTETAKETDESQKAVFVDLYAQAGAWLKIIDKRRGETGDVKLRKLALEAFAGGDDILTFTLKRVDNHVEGKFLAEEGILRFFGSAIAQFSKDNLE